MGFGTFPPLHCRALCVTDTSRIRTRRGAVFSRTLHGGVRVFRLDNCQLSASCVGAVFLSGKMIIGGGRALRHCERQAFTARDGGRRARTHSRCARCDVNTFVVQLEMHGFCGKPATVTRRRHNHFAVCLTTAQTPPSRVPSDSCWRV